MKTMKRMMGFMFFLAIFLSQLYPSISYAKEKINGENKQSNISDNIVDLYGYAAKVYDLEDPTEEYMTNIENIVASEDNILLDSNGCIKFVDIIGTLPGGNFINISRQVQWSSSDSSVAICEYGRIFAKGSGQSIITATYEGLSVTIEVSVISDVNWENYVKSLELNLANNENNGFGVYSVPGRYYFII